MNEDITLQGGTGAFDFDSLDWDKSGDGLLPAVVQDADTGTVLMLGYQDRTALEETFRRGRVVFFSRSRQELWEKGETSGNTLEFVGATPDCDLDTILIHARPTGPVCHTGAPACFSDAEPPLAFLAALERVVTSRKDADADSSYTAKLFADGVKRIAQKVGEEGVETALAATAGEEDELRSEAADLLYHLTVLLAASGLSLRDVISELESRHR
ncbi:MAG: bifunctional phosphoribosyl-AMP cyclohydrolase/phosphoribosyl-ATP diphosphatase HisIE [Gammaproteobacteria bacterium]|nr:bifunctional phosphoribosyl-AMP cyclohydrolase/phosphoribosyl-ATP diphosphatase HisIE [Gammaproteobacteria bacterium]